MILGKSCGQVLSAQASRKKNAALICKTVNLGRWVYLLALVTITGCTTLGPDYQQPQVSVTENWLESEHAKISPEQVVLKEWWKVFNDPVLNTLIDKAYKQNLTLQIAGLRILEARAQLGIASGNRYPQLQQLSAQYTNVSASRNSANSAAADLNYHEAELGFDAAWELDIWGRFRRGMEAADAELMASIADYDDVLVSLTAEVARTYILIRTFEERLRLTRENVAIQERSLEISEAQFEGGLVTELDVQQAKSLMLSTQAEIPLLESQLRQVQNGLSILLGIPPQDLHGLLGGPGNIPAVPPNVAVGIPADLLRRRPDIRRAELLAAAQSARIGLAKTDLYPHFTLFGTIGLRTTENSITKAGGDSSDLGDLFSSDSVEVFGGPSLTWDIFNYGRLKNRVRVQDARFQELVVNYQETVLRSAQEVEDGLVTFLRNQVRKKYLGEGVKASKRSVDLSLIQYREGLVDYQRVLDTQRALFRDQDVFTATSGDVALGLVSLYKAMGGGWQIRQGKDFIPENTKKVMAERTNWGKYLEGRFPESSSEE